MGRPIPLKIARSHGGLGSHLIHGSSGPPESSTQTASWSIQQFLQGSLLWQTDRQTDHHATRSVTIGRIYVRSTAMRCGKLENLTLLNCILFCQLYWNSPVCVLSKSFIFSLPSVKDEMMPISSLCRLSMLELAWFSLLRHGLRSL